MEQTICPRLTPPLSSGGAFQNGTQQRDAFGESVLTDSVLEELKKQSANGCLLCSLETWGGEDWD